MDINRSRDDRYLLVGTDRDLVLLPERRRDRLLARWRSCSLDAALAAGHPSSADRLTAVRATMLVQPRFRAQLAEGWQDLLQRAARPGPDPVPLMRGRIRAAGPEIGELVRALRTPLPVPAQGVARANLLLTDGAGPVYRASSRIELGPAIRAAIEQLDPAGILDHHPIG